MAGTRSDEPKVARPASDPPHRRPPSDGVAGLRGTAQAEARGSGSYSASNSIIQGGFTGTGNLPDNPQFDAGYHLGPSSPAIDSGDNAAVPSGVREDLNGNLRFFDDPSTPDTGPGVPPIVDRGVYEFGSPPACPDCDGDCTAPETCDRAWTLPDGSVNFDDVNAALALVAPGPTSVAPDLTWVDLHGNATGMPGSHNFDPPNFVLNFSDIGQILSGFGGFPYKGYDPADCPDVDIWP